MAAISQWSHPDVDNATRHNRNVFATMADLSTIDQIKTAEAAADDGSQASRGPLHPLAVWKRLRRDKVAVFGGFLVIFFVLMAALAPVLAPYPPKDRDASRRVEPPYWLDAPRYGKTVAADAPRHVLGLDTSGSDILSRVIFGARTSLMVGVAVVTLASLIGITLGALAGYIGGGVDATIMRFVDMLLAFPFLILAIAVISIFPQTTVFHIALVLGLTSWPGICRLMRAQVMATRELDFVNAARALGAGHGAIVIRHVLPNCIAPVIIWYTAGIAGAIMSEASLSFLGFGDPESLSWGSMIDNGLRKANFPTEWWPVAFPAAALAMLVLAFNLLGDGLQDAINPKLKK
ncbi:MAG: ABC transporter permease [Candidatus Sumerlaeaceae bacterium]|nr:ABC transporter permease [Candidatus Sumerlaeaceae bacterium]